eukprot:TRINITY_DN6632_c0_g1_i2.p1 TRINITY_DN6632_c0_g1~~TRINITY_DN6632_c0_g1_i2.p1  ORF type:complete len:133 (-),score=0.78 TRINITY_DN6632_c0_g1_i2:33-431(-)
MPAGARSPSCGHCLPTQHTLSVLGSFGVRPHVSGSRVGIGAAASLPRRELCGLAVERRVGHFVLHVEGVRKEGAADESEHARQQEVVAAAGAWRQRLPRGAASCHPSESLSGRATKQLDASALSPASQQRTK